MDERRDPIRSTDAALEFLEDLYERFGDWTLALAAYNCGPGRVAKAIKLSGKNNFWDIQAYLPRETRNYVPKFIAACYLMNYYYLHDISPEAPNIDFNTTTVTKVYDQLSFDDINKITGVSKDNIRKLNPAFIRHFIPASNKGFNLILPEYSMSLLVASAGTQNIFRGFELMSFENYSNGNSWTPKREVLSVSELESISVEGRKISADDILKRPKIEVENAIEEKYETYRLGRGESILEVVSRRRDLKLKEVLILNNISLSSPPNPGTIIKLKKI